MKKDRFLPVVLMLIIISISHTSLFADKCNFHFDGSISREVLENYLSRAITMLSMNIGMGNTEDNIRMLKNTGAKFVGRTILLWGSESDIKDEKFLRLGSQIAGQVHQIDPEIILQAGIFEIVTKDVNALTVPAWVFREFCLEPEDRKFDYNAMLFSDGRLLNHWGQGQSVPDISRLETKMWFFYLAVSYINIGMESLHFGNVKLMSSNDPGYMHWWELLGRVRNYARRYARRHFVLCDAHAYDGGYVLDDGRLLLDFHSFPLRIKETVGSPQKAELAVGYLDSIFGRSKGGITPSGWKCEHLAYQVEIDNWGSSGKAGQSVGGFWVWGYDEISWFAHQSEQYRNNWLRYAWNWVREHDSNGFLQMPGSRHLADPVDGRDRYFANTRSQSCPQGYNQEEIIKAIWSEYSGCPTVEQGKDKLR